MINNKRKNGLFLGTLASGAWEYVSQNPSLKIVLIWCGFAKNFCGKFFKFPDIYSNFSPKSWKSSYRGLHKGKIQTMVHGTLVKWPTQLAASAVSGLVKKLGKSKKSASPMIGFLHAKNLKCGSKILLIVCYPYRAETNFLLRSISRNFFDTKTKKKRFKGLFLDDVATLIYPIFDQNKIVSNRIHLTCIFFRY